MWSLCVVLAFIFYDISEDGLLGDFFLATLNTFSAVIKAVSVYVVGIDFINIFREPGFEVSATCRFWIS